MKNKILIPAICFFLCSCVSLKYSGYDVRDIITRAARNLLNKDYAYGKQSENEGFDCSGLTQYVYSQAGIKIPRASNAQYEKSVKISKDMLKQGDLVFFSTYAAGPTHVGIFIGDGKFIHAPSEGKKVETADMENSYWKKAFFGAGTYL